MKRRYFLASLPFIPSVVRTLCRIPYIRSIPGIMNVRMLFERDYALYQAINRGGVVVSTRAMRIPLILRHGEQWK